MARTIPLMTGFDGGPSDDGSKVVLSCRLDTGGSVRFAIDREKTSWIIAKLAEWTREAAKKAGWKAQRIAQRDDTGIWMKPTQYGLVDVDEPDIVYLAIDVGPVRFRFAVPISNARSLGETLITASAPKTPPS